MRENFLLGATKDNELVFGEFEITTRNGYPEFSACFYAVSPFNGDEINIEKYYSDVEFVYGKESCYDLCKQYECSPQDLPQALADDCDDARDCLDCSYYSEEIIINGNRWFFESSHGGQYDSRKDIKIYVNKEAYDLLHELWDEYHLKNITENESEVREKYNRIKNLLFKTDEEEQEWIKNFIKENII